MTSYKNAPWIIALAVSLAACEFAYEASPVSSRDPASAPVCGVPVEKVLAPARIDGGRHLYFNPSELDFLFDPYLRIDSLDLFLTLRGKYKGEEKEVSLSLNGIQAAGADRASHISLDRFSSSENKSVIKFNLKKMRLNGAMIILNALLKVKKHKGDFRLSLHGRKLHLLDVSFVVNGRNLADCGGGSGSDPSRKPKPDLPEPSKADPNTSIVSVTPAESPTASTTLEVAFTADQADVTYECSLDGAVAAPCSSPHVLSGLGNGAHSFLVRAINSKGFRDTDGVTYSWSVDSLPPSVQIINASALPNVTSATSISVEFSATDESGIAGFECTLDDSAPVACNSPASFADLSDGVHRLSIVAIDGVGNRSDVPAVHSWSVDTVAPVARFVQAEPAALRTNSVDMILSFAADESATFECSLDGAVFAGCASPASLTSLAEGGHSFAIRATDVAGNVSALANYAWNIDLTPPALSIGNVLPPEGLTNAELITTEFAASEPVTYSCAVNGIDAGQCASPFSFMPEADGNYELVISAVDEAGNAGAPVRLAWIIDQTVPQLAWGLILPSAASYINSTSLEAEVTSSENVSLSCSLDGVDLGQNASPVLLSGIAEGAHQLVVMGNDSAGNVSGSISHSFVVDVTAPAVAVSAAVSGGVTSESVNSFSFTASEEARTECQLDGAGFSECVSPVSIAGLAEGDHVYEVRAVDLAGNVGAAAAVSWTVDLTAPVSSIVADRPSNSSITFTLGADEAVQGFECSLDGAAFAACASPVSYSNLADGAHSFAVRATDLAGNVESSPQTYSWTVAAAVTTKITSASTGGLTNVTSISIYFTASVADSTFVCSWDGGAEEACSSPASASGFGNGSHQFKVRAIDPYGNEDLTGATYSWTVDTAAPVIGSLSTSVTSYSITIKWTTNEPATSKVNWGLGSDTSRVIAEDNVFKTSHSVTISGLSRSTIYSFYVSGRDRAGNRYQSAKKSAKTY